MKYQARTIKGALYDRKHGNSKFLADTVTVTYPDIELLTETLKGAGINGEIDLPTYGQFGPMEVEVAHNGLNEENIKLFGMETQNLEHRWATQVLNSETGTTEVVSKKVIWRGIPKKFGLGSIEPNKAEEPTSSFELTYIKYMIGNKRMFEIDKLNDVFIVGDTDYSATIKAAL